MGFGRSGLPDWDEKGRNPLRGERKQAAMEWWFAFTPTLLFLVTAIIVGLVEGGKRG